MPAPPSTVQDRTDYRLLLPAVTAWAVAAAVLSVDPRRHPLLLVAASVAAAAALVLLTPKGPRPSVHRLTAAVLLTAAAATTTTVLHTADLHRGPLPALARPPEPPGREEPEPAPVPGRPGSTAQQSEPERADQPEPGGQEPGGRLPAQEKPANPRVAVELTITGDPKPHGAHAQGTGLSRPTLTISALVTRVRPTPLTPTVRAPSVATRTPVTLLVRSQDPYQWQQLIPSTELALEAEVLPDRQEDGSAAGGRSRTDTAALLAPQGQPRVLAPPDLPQRLASRLRKGLRDACDHLSSDPRGLLPGLVVGDVSRLPDDLSDAFRATDLGHLVAVSGANLAIILAVLVGGTPTEPDAPARGGLAGVLGLSFRTTALLGTGLTLAFVTICRPDPSVLRAAATGLLGLLALATGRPRQGVPTLAGAVLILVLVDPQLARSYGFLLSALATAGLLILGPRWTAALRARRWPHHLASAVGATAAAQAFCSPVTVLLAPRVSLVGIPCNLLAEVAVAPATLLGFGALAIAPFSAGAARFLADLAAVPVGWLATVARRGAELPGAELAWPAGPYGAVLLVVVIVALAWAVPPLLARHRARRRRTRVLVALTVVVALPLVLLRPPSVVRLATGWPATGWRLAMCDIGQGDMTVLPVEPGTAVVVDAGPDAKSADACLRDLGVTRVPVLILTHFHADHAEGIPGVLRGRAVGAIEVTTLDEPDGERARVLRWAAAGGIPVMRAQRGEQRTAGARLGWQVLWPTATPEPDAAGPNNSSIAILATLGPPATALRVALLGDLEPPAQAAVLHLGALGTPPRARPPPDAKSTAARGRGDPAAVPASVPASVPGAVPAVVSAGVPAAGPGVVDVLKVAHHGSANQDWSLMASLHPRLALISCGTGNPYGHPAPQTVAGLKALGATVVRTDRSGDIAVLGDARTLAVATHLRSTR
ncbi:ComEC/Rec2 family competence protein [Streptomyces sp. TLI_171]|uniref:ComEC/Rec2 family competence protein n=1 Tax=Streptomyces sp. TLI_171 TaxID=1938859 RepID=UPI000C190155|nr:ComEC/Rec2 family competence protein [Streptomyces sp. TLI_171]RKE19057.1 competence protein ComEC [Streptomyces sp. TLI_171]